MGAVRATSAIVRTTVKIVFFIRSAESLVMDVAECLVTFNIGNPQDFNKNSRQMPNKKERGSKISDLESEVFIHLQDTPTHVAPPYEEKKIEVKK